MAQSKITINVEGHKDGRGDFRMGVCQLVDEDGNPPSKEVMDYLILREFEFTTSHFTPGLSPFRLQRKIWI